MQGRKSGSVLPGCAPGGARRCNSGQQEFTKALDPDSLRYTTLNTTGDKTSPSLHR